LIFDFNLRENTEFSPTHPKVSYGHTIHRRLLPILAEKQGGISATINSLSKKMNARVGFFAEYRKLKAKYVPVRNRLSINTLTHFE
jgi:ABC-type uncharacterized transport system ATPase subunit